MKRLFKSIIWVVVILGILSGSFLLWSKDKYVVPILMYHGIDHSDRPKTNTVSPETFSKQLEYFKKHGYKIVSLEEWVNTINQNKAFIGKTAVLTFDDGLEDNYTQAFPILKQYNVPAIIFVVTDVVGKQGFLSWEQIKEMEKYGIIFGSHTRLHTYLPSLDRAEQRNQIQISKEILEGQLGHKIDFFAYPSGGFNESIEGLVKEAGYTAACTTNRGYHPGNNDLYEIKRIRLNDGDTSELILWAKLSGYYQIFRKWKPPE